MTRPFDLVETDDELDAIFGKPAREPRADPRGAAGAPAREPLPRPICALFAPEPEPVTWIVQDLFTAGDIGLIVGDGGSFKSSAAVHIAAAVAGGYKAFDRFETIGPAPVLVCSAEDPGSVIQMRLEAFVRGHDWDRAEVLRNFHYFAMAGVRLKDGRWKQHLVDVVDDLEPAFVVLDPFVDLSGLEEENSNSEAGQVMSYARHLARRSGAAVSFVHHGNKSSEGRTQSRIRGATTIANASRGTLFFEFTEAGVLVEQLKMTYAEKVPPFMLTRDIKSEPTNKAQWITARLATIKPDVARLSRAEEFVLGQVRQSPGVLNSRGLRAAAKGSGIWSSDVDKAVKTLFAKDMIYPSEGPSKSKLWHPTEGVTSHPLENELSGVSEGFGTLGTPRPERAKSAPGGLNSPAAGVPSLREGTGTPADEAAMRGTPDWRPEDFDESQAEAVDS